MALIETEVAPEEQTRRLLRDTLTGSFNMLRGAFGSCEQLVWQNQFGLTPQQVFDALGTDAAQLIGVRNQLLPLLQQFGEVLDLRPEGAMVNVHQDGTVAVVLP